VTKAYEGDAGHPPEWHVAYRIAGAVNEGRPNTTVTLVTRPGSFAELPPADATWANERVVVGGQEYLLGHPIGDNPYGVYRVDWTDGTTAYTLMCERLNRSGGISGLAWDELKKMAFSVA
jgi:hypothetical protein